MKELTIDVHGMYVADAMEKIRLAVARVPREVERVVIVHGYNHGTSLRDAVRTRLRLPRVQLVEPSFLNDGITYLWLKRG